MPGLGALWDSLVDCICRPPRDEYIYPDELVGGSRRLFRVGRYPGIREDLTLTNKRGLLLQCSHYLPKHVKGKDGRLPCVIYCHCNSGSRRDAEEAICVLIPCGVSVFTLDFAGSGLSEGQWVTLGAEEVDDVATAVEHLRAGGRVSTLGLWGRSMGAVTALLYSQRDPSIAGMVLDSPFSRLTDLMLEIVQEQRLPIPRPLAKLALAAMKRSVMKRAGFDIAKVSPVDAVSQSFIPALFGHATGDTFIRISHAEALHEAYAGDKNLIRFEGDHNSRRPEFFYNSVSIFWHNTLQLELMLEPADVGTPAAPPGAAAAALGTGPGTGMGGSGRHGAGRPLRPPPSHLRQPHSNPALSADPPAAGAAAAATGAGPAGQGAAAGGSGTAAAAGGGGGGSAEEDEGVDVTREGMAARSAPWEPRLWEPDADKAARERQRFRRTAGGLPSPAYTPDGGSAADGPLGASGAGGRAFRTSAELARLFATASDESLAARLLGEDPQWSAGGGTSGTAAGVGPAGAAPPNPRLVRSLMASAMLLPETEEEEEAQLAAALQLSLLEAVAGDGPPTEAAIAAGAGPVRAGSGNMRGGARPDSRADDATRARGPTEALPSLNVPDAAGAGPSQSGGAAAATMTVASAHSVRSSSQEDALGAPALALGVVSTVALSGPAHPGQQPETGAARTSGATLQALREATSRADETGPVGAGEPPVAAGHEAPRRPSSAGRRGGSAPDRHAPPAGLSVYDMYTEDELMSLAVQLSLQESAAATAAPPAEPAPTSGGTSSASDAGAAASTLPSLL